MFTTTRISGALLLCILLSWASVFTCAAVDSQNILPSRWDFPAPFEYTVKFTGQDTITVYNLRIVLEMFYTDNSGEKTPLNLDLPPTCAVEINDGPQAIITSDIVNSIIYLDFSISTTINLLHILCHEMSVSRPMPYPADIPNAFPAQIEVTVQDNSGSIVYAKSTHPIQILNEPAFHHQYRWTHPESSEITVTFTFYRPAGCDDIIFTFDDPHLQVPLLKSLALPDEGDRFDDLAKPFNLLSTPLVVCKSSPAEDGQILSADVYLDTSELSISSAPPLDKPFICSFQIVYPPDALGAIHHRSDAPIWSITYASGTNNPVLGEIRLPYAIPDQYRMSATPSYYGLHIWLSSYHFYSTQQLMFEFGISTTHQFIDLDSPQKMVKGQNAPQLMTLHIYMDGDSFNFSQWNPIMTCTNHLPPLNLEFVNITDDDIDIAPHTFRRFGQKCRVYITVPASHANRLLSPLQIRFMPSVSSTMQPGQYFFTLFDAFHRALLTQHKVLTLHDSDHVQLASLPPIERFQFPFTFTVDKTTGNVIYHLQMNVQYLSHRTHVDSTETRMVLLCVFPQLRAITDLNISIAPVVTLDITSGGYPVFFQEDLQLSAFTMAIPTTIEVPDDNNEMNIFQHGRPIRAPYLAIPLPMGFDTTRPLFITLSIPSTSTSPVITPVYPILLPQHYADVLVYSRQYALITPPPNTPLMGYFYRCVTWDSMAAPYVYGGPEQLTDTNSMVCPPFPQDGEAINPAVWKHIRYTVPNGQTHCVYELAAVCVTRSQTNPDAYDVHPLADCPSFLGSKHSVSCGSVDNDEEEWNSNTDGIVAKLSAPELDEEFIHKKRTIRLRWMYAGDPRRTLAASIRPLLEGRDNDGEDEPHGWVTLARDIPAYLAPPSAARPQWQEVTIGFPILSPMVEAVIIRLTLNGAIGAGQSTQITHTMQAGPWAGYETGCYINSDKAFDDITHLCRCADGFTSTDPTQVQNPFVHPLEFACEPCGPGTAVGQCSDQNGDVECDNYGVWSPSFQRCVCMTGYYGEYCQYDDTTDPTLVCEELQCVADHTMKGDVSGDGVISNGECAFDNDNDSDSSSVICNCADGFTGDQCQHQAVCGVRQCVNGRLVSPTGKPEQCKCECNNDYITGSACNQCTLACRNGGVANTRCTACQCPAGYIGTTCTIPVWYHTFTLRNLPQHIVELILGTTASDKEQMAILQQTMVKYLLEDYSRVLSETFIVVDGDDDNDNPDDNDNRIRVRVELSQFQTVIPPANPNAPYVHIQLMLYPADMTEEMLAYALQHGLDFDWSRVTDNLNFFKQFLREQGIVDDDDDLTPDIDDPGCTTRECREKIIEEESSNHASTTFGPVIILLICLVAVLSMSCV